MTKNLHGGKRKGAGRKPLYSGAVKRMNVPLDLVPIVSNAIKQFSEHKPLPTHENVSYPALDPSHVLLPQSLTSVSAGFPSPADDYVEGRLDLNEHFIKHPSATFIWRVSGYSMKNAGILPDDLVIVDRSLTAKHGDIVIAEVNGDVTIKYLSTENGTVELLPDNPEEKKITFQKEDDLVIWGVVSGITRKIR